MIRIRMLEVKKFYLNQRFFIDAYLGLDINAGRPMNRCLGVVKVRVK